MNLQHELGFPNPIADRAHEALLNVALTGSLLAKEGDRIARPFGLTDSQFNVLMILRYQSKDGAINQTQLGRMLLVNRSNVTGLIDRMEQAGWAERADDPGDRRVKQVRLTPEGRRLAERVEQVYYARVTEVMGALNPREQAQLCRLLERLRAGLHGPRGR